MAQTYELEAQKRTLIGRKVGALRRAGLVPAIMYNARKGQTNLQIPYRALEIILTKAGGTHLINLNVDGTAHTVLTREVQRDIVKRTIIHVDFLEVDKTTRITYEVPIHVVGESPAVLAKLGMVTMNTNTLTVESLASNLLERIDVDISGLKHTGDMVTIGDLKLGEGMKIEGPLDEVVLRIAPFATTTAEEEAVEEGAISAEPEVIKKGKVDEEGVED